MNRPRDIVQYSPVQRKTLHLYRAFLRECTYLPDSAARYHLHHLVGSRFRRFRTLSHDSLNGNTIINFQTTRDRIRYAHKKLHYVQHANGGHMRNLSKVLEMTYGRLGPRREKYLGLLKPTHLTRELASPKSEIVPVSDRGKGDVPVITPQHEVLIRSQRLRPKVKTGRNLTPSLAPTVPKTNAWGRSMPVKRVRNIHRRWYAETLNRTMAPLPQCMWERLCGLAKGNIHWEGPVERRSRPKGEYCWQHDVGMETYRGEGKISRPHTISRRYMQRLWSRVLAQSPRMEVRGAEGLHVGIDDLKMNSDYLTRHEEDEQTDFKETLESDLAEKKTANARSHWKVHWMDVQKQKNIFFAPNKPIRNVMFSGVDGKGKRLTK